MSKIVWNLYKLKRPKNITRPWYRFALPLVSSIVHSTSTIVELGCGVGEFAELISQLDVNMHYIGVDGSQEYASITRDAGFNAIIANFEHKLPIPTGTVDVVVTLEVIEHIASAEGFLNEIARILKPDGYLVLTTPNVGFFVHRWRYLTKAEVLQEGIHLRFFNRARLQSIIEKAGFRIVHRNSFTPWLGYNTLGRIVFRDFSRRYFTTPDALESFMATNFVWLLKIADGSI